VQLSALHPFPPPYLWNIREEEKISVGPGFDHAVGERTHLLDCSQQPWLVRMAMDINDLINRGGLAEEAAKMFG
jgi:hypothetical protein